MHTPTPTPKPLLQRQIPPALRMLLLAAVTVLTVAACTLSSGVHSPSGPGLPLRQVATLALPGDTSRFDYTSLDPARGWLFIGHLGAGEVIEVDINSHRVVRTISGIDQVHGVLTVGGRNRVYATATGTNQVVAIDETTGDIVARGPTGAYPDGLTYDPHRNRIWTTNETAGTETVLDADTLQPITTLDIGGQVGNVVYDPATDRIYVAAQDANDLVIINPEGPAIVDRVALPGCAHPHGLAIDSPHQLIFAACEHNATLKTIDASSGEVIATNPVGDDPDVLAYDTTAQRLYVAAESGILTTLDAVEHTVTVTGTGQLAKGGHVVAVNPENHHTYYPIPAGPDGTPVLLEQQPT